MDRGNAESRFWDLYSHTYDAIGFSIPYRRHLDALVDALDLPPAGAEVLDLGCATGNLERRLAERVPGARVVGVDYSEAMLRRARRKCASCASVEFRHADLSRRLPFDDASFDRVVGNNVLYALPEPGRALDEAARVLRPGGRLVLSDPKPGASIREVVKAHFAAISAMRCGRAAAYGRTLLTLPLMGLAPILLSTMAIGGRVRRGEYRFSDEAGLRLLFSAFSDVEVSTVYAGQSWLVTARRP